MHIVLAWFADRSVLPEVGNISSRRAAASISSLRRSAHRQVLLQVFTQRRQKKQRVLHTGLLRRLTPEWADIPFVSVGTGPSTATRVR